MPRLFLNAVGLASLALAAIVSHAASQPSSAIAVAPHTAPHPLMQGTPVYDKSGLRVGVVAAVADSDRGSMVVVKVDGKLVSVPQSSLVLDGNVARSAQTKAEMLAAATAH